MTHTKSLARLLTVAVIGAFAIAMLSFALAPPASLFG